MAISTATHGSIERPRTATGIDEDRLDTESESLFPRSTTSEARGRWFDLCFRLIILALAALWLFAPPAGTERSAADEKAVATTR
ncbi:hypothetical protein [Bosea sp. ANAM02]|uniref:hypothetical protein n=1 Tax=Bosea sp. ANAM02 TaxID=2020412 RepID=UPI00140F292E|nr:hypothetical protein [Bosea sp. ANAM02]BCB19834.1 hypothetical protein OCUBac02_27280 [Bosea sp. ANAM02]